MVLSSGPFAVGSGWVGWVIVTLIIIAFWAVPIVATLALFRTSHRNRSDAGRAMTESPSERILLASGLRCLHHQLQDLDAHAPSVARPSGRSVTRTAHITRQRAIDQTAGLLANCRTRVVIPDMADSHPCALTGSTSAIPYPPRVYDRGNSETATTYPRGV